MRTKIKAELTAVEKKLNNVYETTEDPFDAVPLVKRILDQCDPGTSFILNDKTMYYQYVKCEDGKWDVTLGRSQTELEMNKASHDSANMTAGEVVNCLYKLE